MTNASNVELLNELKERILEISEPGEAKQYVSQFFLCYHTQQAVEKSLKAVLLKNGVDFPYTHKIAWLITILQEADLRWPQQLNAAAELTP